MRYTDEFWQNRQNSRADYFDAQMNQRVELQMSSSLWWDEKGPYRLMLVYGLKSEAGRKAREELPFWYVRNARDSSGANHSFYIFP